MTRIPLLTGVLLTLLLGGLPAAGAHTEAATTIHPIYATLSGDDSSTSSSSTLMRSIDGGLTWQAPTSHPSDALSGNGSLAVAADGTVYVGTADQVFRSTDNGKSWRALSAQPGGTDGLAADPTQPNVLYAFYSYAVARSSNGGQTWKGEPIPNLTNSESQINCLAVSPLRPAMLLAGETYGVEMSWTSSASWIEWQPRDHGDDLTRGVAFSPADPLLAYAATTYGLYETRDAGLHWQTGWRGLPPNTAMIRVAVNPNSAGQVIAAGDRGQIYRSTDGGTSWEQVLGSGGPQITALLYPPAYPGLALAATSDGSTLYVSHNGGGYWQKINPGFGKGHGVLVLAAAR